ncbi:MAG: hypothetical protein IKM04_01265 [Clostridia bacterium]|nr:hypothetical protein [Clostridia bacterium]
MSRSYDDIIDLPRHVSKKHPPMSLYDRAAQFSAFSALVGYDEAIAESDRLTDKRIPLSEDDKAELDRKLSFLEDSELELTRISVTYFKPDGKKEGGRYVTEVGEFLKTDPYERVLIIGDGIKIPLEDVFKIDSELFRGIF